MTLGKTAGFRSPSSEEREPATETVRSTQGTPAALPVRRAVYDCPQFPYAIWPQCGPEWANGSANGATDGSPQDAGRRVEGDSVVDFSEGEEEVLLW